MFSSSWISITTEFSCIQQHFRTGSVNITGCLNVMDESGPKPCHMPAALTHCTKWTWTKSWWFLFTRTINFSPWDIYCVYLGHYFTQKKPNYSTHNYNKHYRNGQDHITILKNHLLNITVFGFANKTVNNNSISQSVYSSYTTTIFWTIIN